jgi:hypothetical protein
MLRHIFSDCQSSSIASFLAGSGCSDSAVAMLIDVPGSRMMVAHAEVAVQHGVRAHVDVATTVRGSSRWMVCDLDVDARMMITMRLGGNGRWSFDQALQFCHVNLFSKTIM